MKKFTVLLVILLPVISVLAQPAATTKTEVVLLGSFHFANPGLDVAKFESANILSEKRQKEVEEVVAKIKKFKPDKIFVEILPSMQKKYDSLLAAYKNGNYKLGASETEQLGFRLAKEIGLDTLHCANYTAISFPIDSVVKIMAVNQQMDMLQYFQSAVQKEQNQFNEELKTKTIGKILLDGNTEEIYKKLAGVYYYFLKAGDKKNHAGSFLASEQWRRNIHIYENILKSLSGKEQRILVIFGTTHAAILKEMMKYNDNFKIIPVSKVLKG